MTTNLDLMISMFISFILIAGILYVSDFSLRDFSKIEKVVIDVKTIYDWKECCIRTLPINTLHNYS